MKRFIALAVCLAAGTLAAADDPNAVRDEVYVHLQTAAQKQQQLRTKTYTGTFDQILATRVADVNNVTAEIAAAKDKCQRVLTQTGEAVSVADKLKAIISEKTKEQEQLNKKRNGEFMSAVNQIVTDPNQPTADEDPDEAGRLAMFWDAVTVAVEEMGGL